MAGTRAKRGNPSAAASASDDAADGGISSAAQHTDYTEDALLNLQSSIISVENPKKKLENTGDVSIENNSSPAIKQPNSTVPNVPPSPADGATAPNLKVVASNPTPKKSSPKNPSSPAPIAQISTAWRSRLLKSGKAGPAKKTLFNAAIPLQFAPEFQNALRYNSSALCIMIEKPMPWEDKATFSNQLWSDHDTLKYTEWLQRNQIDVIGRVASDAVLLVSQDRQFHPIKDYFESLQWDGEPRLDCWLAKYANCSDTPYVRLIGPKFMISCVARTYEAGCKAECVLILVGEQGEKKSTLLQVLVGKDWFTDQIGFIGNKDASIALAGKLLVEFADLDGFTGRSADELKAFFSRQSDRYRAPYGRLAEDHPRQTIFAGTTNLQTPLKDFTGNRRFWVVKVRRADILGLRENREQLWAEAVHRYKAGENWWLETDEEKTIAEKEVEEYRDIDDWEDLIGRYLTQSKRKEVKTLEILDLVFDIEPKAANRAQLMRVGHCLHALGWRRRQVMRDGRRLWIYYPKGTMPD